MRTTETFEQHLRKSNLSENTIHSYLWTVDFYHAHYDAVSKENLLAYKGYLMEFFKPKTVNLRIQAMNKYLDFLHRDRLRLRAVKVQQKNFLENVISNADYNFLKKQLKKDGNMEWYFVVWYLAATGARVSELIQIKIEHVELGYFDLYTKGGKLRRLYIPKKLRTETLEWLEETQRFSGFLFLNRYGERITTRGISQQLKNYADKYGLDKKVVYPHSFRHRYAKNFLEKYNDIALLCYNRHIAITTWLFHYAPFHWAVGTFQCTRFERAMVVAFYFRLHLAYFPRPVVAIFARPEHF